MSEYDSPWKEALDQFFPVFLAFFFPAIHADIDWSQDYEVLDKELEQIVREGETGKREADKPFKVWRRGGEETWVLIHLEIQSQYDAKLSERIFTYFYRIFDRYHLKVVSVVVLGDDRPNWRPQEYGYSFWGFSVSVHFPFVKLLDYAGDLAALQANANPFGLIVAAHLQSMATRSDVESRRGWKVRLVKGLYDRGLNAEQVRLLFKVIDWLMDLPKAQDKLFLDEIDAYEKERKMPYVTSVERIARQEGLEQGRQEGLLEGILFALEMKFGGASHELSAALHQITDLNVLQATKEALRSVQSVEEAKQVLSSQGKS